MQKFYIGEHVKFKNATTGFRLYLDQKFEVAGYPLDVDDRPMYDQVLLEGVGMTGIMAKTAAFVNELDLILPNAINDGGAGVGSWWASAKCMVPDVTSIVGDGLELAVNAAKSLPNHLPDGPNPFQSGGGGDFGGAGASGSWTDPIVEQVSQTVASVMESTGGVLSSVVDTAGTCAAVVGDTMSSVADVAGDVCSGVADAAGSIDL